jgi:hypothetical protein
VLILFRRNLGQLTCGWRLGSASVSIESASASVSIESARGYGRRSREHNQAEEKRAKSIALGTLSLEDVLRMFE